MVQARPSVVPRVGIISAQGVDAGVAAATSLEIPGLGAVIVGEMKCNLAVALAKES